MRRNHELSGSIAGCCFILCLVMVIIAILTGCTVEHRAPQLDAAIKAISQPRCPTLMPIPARMLIDIDGPSVTADIEGEAFLRQYVSVRSCLRAAP